MSSETVVRPARVDELSAVLRLWQESDVTPPSITDSIEGLTRLMREPGGMLLVARIDGRIIGSVIGGWDGWGGNIYRLAGDTRAPSKGDCAATGGGGQQRAFRQGRHQNLGPR
jgi:hypothetical protein